MKLTRIAMLFVLVVLLARTSPAAEPPKHRKLSAVPFTAVKVQDEFWAPRIRINREKSLPHNFKWCEQTGRFSNFAKAGGLAQGKFEGIYFNDSDVYKVLEGAAYSLADHPDPVLEKMTEDVIAKIAAAQQKDGYLNTFFTLAQPGKRWTDLAAKHELYCAGHMIEGAVAHYRATGKKTFLDVAVKFADHIDREFGPGRRPDPCGHEEVELALVKLFQATGEKRYFDLAKFFIDARGDSSKRKTWGPYCQDHAPVRKQSEIVGHAVRAMYLYSGVADVAAYSGDKELIDAMDRLWQDVVKRKMYITAGIGARHAGEAFGNAYELPNDSAYCETCAAIGLALWAHRLNLMHGDAQYADVLERGLYNGILSGIGLDGEHFFYVNPLASGGKHHRQPFFACACCPSNVVRFVPSLPGYVYATGENAIYVNLYVAGKATVPLGDNSVTITQETKYPWDGKVKLTIEPKKASEFAVYLRIPEWCKGARLSLRGKDSPSSGWVTAAEEPKTEKGYARVARTWSPGDAIVLDLPMPVERIEAHPAVKADAGRVAVQRGPVVYCFEAGDNDDRAKNITLPRDPKFTVEHRADLLGGVTVIKGVDVAGKPITAVPYAVWDHRQPGEMAVWVRQDGKSRTPQTDDPAWADKLYRPLDPATLGDSTPLTLSESCAPSASHANPPDAVTAMNDLIEPRDSNDHAVPRCTWWDHRGTKEWVQYDFPAARKVSAVEVYWFDDTGKGQCRVPQSWTLLYKDGDSWKPVAGAAALGTELNKFNRTTFTPVETSALRIEVQLKPEFSGGVLEWKVE